MSAVEAEIARLGRRVRDEPRSTAFVALADALRRAGRHAEGLQALREGFRVHPDHPPARVVLARIHLEMGHRALAIEVLGDVLEGDPENLAATSLLARLYVEEGRGADARPLVERLRIAGHPDAALREHAVAAARVSPLLRGPDPFDHPALATRFARAGHYPRAWALWRRLGAALPASADPQDLLAVREQMGALERCIEGGGDAEGEPPLDATRPRRPLPGRAEACAALCEDPGPPPRTRRGHPVARYARHFWRTP
jgi:cytochrome c-type biogenesis protein CcmH/NrfG